MIEQASVSISHDNGVLIVIPRSGMDIEGNTTVSVDGGMLRVGQSGTWFVSVDLPDMHIADAIRGNSDVTILEADDEGFDFHTNVRARK